MKIQLWKEFGLLKKSITIHDRHITEKRTAIFDYIPYASYSKGDLIDLIKPKKNIFEIKHEFNKEFKHWAIILAT